MKWEQIKGILCSYWACDYRGVSLWWGKDSEVLFVGDIKRRNVKSLEHASEIVKGLLEG